MTGRAAARGGAGLSTAGHAAIAVAAVASVLLLVTYVSLSSCRAGTGRILERLQDSEEKLDPAILEHQNGLVRNLTARVQTAEAALQRLRDMETTKLQLALAEQRKRLMQKKQVAASVAGGAPRAQRPSAQAAQQAGSTEEGADADEEDDDSSEEDEEDEGVFDEGEEFEEETKLQLKLINFDPVNKTFQRFRSDFKCGPGAPDLPDDQVVECNPRSRMPCCSSLGWCGITRTHCVCSTCVDYRKVRKQRKQQR